MWQATLASYLMLWSMWDLVPSASSTQDPSMTEMAQMFQDFMMRFNKTYQSQAEMQHRFKIFVQNLHVSRALQASELGTARYGVTPFSDLTESEFGTKTGSLHPPEPPTWRHTVIPLESQNRPSCDWRKLGAITAVKDQGLNCKACWAFAAVSNIEALWNIRLQHPRNLSVQEVVDCTPCRGCQGGFVWDAFLTVLNRSGLMDSKTYRYVGKQQKCRTRSGKVGWIQDYEFLPPDESYMAKVVASRGPITALINKKNLQHYKNGVITQEGCSAEKWPDHAVLIVGYGEAKARRGSWSGRFWIIQNSWGQKWGEKGYFRLQRGTNACGIARYPVMAVVDREKKASLCPL